MTEDDMSHVSEEIQDLANRGWSISDEEYKEMRMNTYEREFLLPYVSVECLCNIAEYYLSQCSRHHDCTYDGAIAYRVIPEMIERLRNTL
jgi:hypothetical protein